MTVLDPAWLAANPVPLPTGDTSKDGRGRVLIDQTGLLKAACPGGPALP